MDVGSISSLIWTIIFLVLSYFLARIVKKWRVWKKNPIPGPAPWPLIGNIPQIATYKHIIQFVNDQVRKHNNGLVRIQIHNHTIYAHGDTKVVKKFLHHPKAETYNALMPFIQGGLVTLEGDTWKKHRRMLEHSFTTSVFRDITPKMVHHSKVMCELLASKKPYEKFDILGPFVNLTFDVIGDTSIGLQFNALTSETRHPILVAMQEVINFIEFISVSPIVLPWQQWKFDRNINFINTEVLKIIAENRGRKEARGDMFDILIKPDPETGDVLDDDDIKWHLNTFFFAGHDTTSTLLTTAIWMVTQRPDLEIKLLDEIDEVLGDRDEPTYDDVQKLTYMRMFLNECLRMYPPASSARMLNVGDEVDGYTIPDNGGDPNLLWINVYQFHHDPSHWDRPFIFDPDRFSPENSKGRDLLAFMPFLSGPRNCIGSRYALLEARIAFTMILKRFSFQPATGATFEFVQSLTSKPSATYVTVEPRIPRK